MFTVLALLSTKTPGDIWSGLIIDAVLTITVITVIIVF